MRVLVIVCKATALSVTDEGARKSIETILTHDFQNGLLRGGGGLKGPAEPPNLSSAISHGYAGAEMSKFASRDGSCRTGFATVLSFRPQVPATRARNLQIAPKVIQRGCGKAFWCMTTR